MFYLQFYAGMFGLWSQGCMLILKKSNSTPGKFMQVSGCWDLCSMIYVQYVL